MADEIFGNPTFREDERGVSHLTYTPLQGIERIINGLENNLFLPIRNLRAAGFNPFFDEG